MESNKILNEEIERFIVKNEKLFSDTDNKVFYITGATGLIGSMVAKILLAANRKYGVNNDVVASVRNQDKAILCYKDYKDDDHLIIENTDIREQISYDGPIDYIIHCASVTSSKEMIEHPTDIITTSVLGTINVLELALKKKTSSVVYISSMETYGKFYNGEIVTEDIYGYIDPLSVRSCYPEGKRMCENLCVSYNKEYGLPIKIARLAQTFGPGVTESDNRIYAQLARAAINKTDIILHTDGSSEGNYCYILDSVMGILTVLFKGENAEAYNVANDNNHMSILNMAYLVANEIANGEITVILDIPEDNIYGYAASTKMKLNGDKLKKLGWNPEVGLKDMYLRLIDYMR